MTRILIAADASDDSIHVAKTARTIFGDGADYMIINVDDSRVAMWGPESMSWGMTYPLVVPPSAAQTSPVPLMLGAEPMHDGHQTPTAAVDLAERQAGDIALDANLPAAQPIGDAGDPATAILLAAETHDVDVIVVGSNNQGWIGRLFTPSVTKTVVRESHCPVLVVP